MDFELTDFLFTATSYRMPFLANVVNLHLMFFSTLAFTGSLEGKLHQCHFLSTKGFLLGLHSSREKTCGVTWNRQELEDRVKQVQYCIARS